MKSANLQTGLVPAAPAEVVSPSTIPSIDINALIAKAVDSKSAVEILKELRLMHSEDRALAAERAFNEALSAFQSECPVIIRSKDVLDKLNSRLYSYAPIEKIEEIIRPVEKKHGFTHTYRQDVESQPGWVIAECIVTHREGHQRVTPGKFPLGNKTSIMSDTQVYAGALTFANRRTLANAYGLVLAGEDKDGQTQREKPANPSALEGEGAGRKLAITIWGLLAPVRGTASNWQLANAWLWREEILDAAAEEAMPNLSTDRLKKVIEACRNHDGLKP
jgi:hypothetical protein